MAKLKPWPKTYKPRIALGWVTCVLFYVFWLFVWCGPCFVPLEFLAGDALAFWIGYLMTFSLVMFLYSYPVFERETACAISVASAEESQTSGTPFSISPLSLETLNQGKKNSVTLGWIFFPIGVALWLGRRRARKLCPEFDKLYFKSGKHAEGESKIDFFCMYEIPEEWKSGRLCEVVVSKCGRYAMPADQHARLLAAVERQRDA